MAIVFACTCGKKMRADDAFAGRSNEKADDEKNFALFVLRMLAVPMVLHGLYDTLLKKEMNVGALVVAVVSFAWLALQIERARVAQPEVAGALGEIP